jgi:lysophospholipase L1-like esterase
MATFKRFIALGDSMTEGMCDEIIDGKYRGWADRVADVLSQVTPEFTYVNLAVRGKLLQQVIDDQIPAALKLVNENSTLISFHAGANDVIRPNYQPAVAKARYRSAVEKLINSGATILLFTVIDKVEGKGKTAELWHERFSDFNKNVREVAVEFGATLVDSKDAPWLADRRFLAVDRLHLNADGHFRLANAVLEVLALPFDEKWKIQLPPAPRKSKVTKFLEDSRWIITFVIPWIWRRLRGKSSGDGRVAKYLAPTNWH